MKSIRLIILITIINSGWVAVPVQVHAQTDSLVFDSNAIEQDLYEINLILKDGGRITVKANNEASHDYYAVIHDVPYRVCQISSSILCFIALYFQHSMNF